MLSGQAPKAHLRARAVNPTGDAARYGAEMLAAFMRTLCRQTHGYRP